MAESVKAYGKILEGNNFEFSLDGMSTYNQMQRLVSLTEAVAKRLKADTSGGPSKEEKEELDLLEKKNKENKKGIKSDEERREASDELSKKINSASKGLDFLKGDFRTASYGLTTFTSILSTGVGTVFGALFGMADSLQLGLQRGVAGGILDFAIAAKTGGVSIGQFSKALEESGGSFASLGDGASQGAKNFGALIGSVRSATSSVGNLGLSNEQLANFTAQQVKVAVQQGFKGKAAQELVVNNSKSLAKELDLLANQTGKSVLELTKAAIKLASDPLVSSFVRSAGKGGEAISAALQSYAANFAALFGDQGDKIIKDTLAPALAGLPLIISQTGQNLASVSQSTFMEMERLAASAKAGNTMTIQDRARLSESIKREMSTRGDQIRAMSELPGPLQEASKQFLAMAAAIEDYNPVEAANREKRDKDAKAFNSAINQFKANLQALAIPFLNLINGIDWTLFIKTVGAVVSALDFMLHLLDPIGKALGGGPGSLLGLLLGIGAIAVISKAGYGILNKSVRDTASVFIEASAKIKAAADALKAQYFPEKAKPRYKMGSDGKPVLVETPGPEPKTRGPMSTGAKLGIAGVVGGGLYAGGEALKESGATKSGAALSVAGQTASMAATGGLIGSFFGPGPGTLIGAAIGGLIGAATGVVQNIDAFSTESAGEISQDLPRQGSDAVVGQMNMQKEQLQQTKTMVASLNQLNENMGYGISLSARQIGAIENGTKATANLQLSQG